MGVADDRQLASPMRLLEQLSDRFGAFEAVARCNIRLSRLVSEDELSMEPAIADALLEFGHDLREASRAAAEWARANGVLDASSEQALLQDEEGEDPALGPFLDLLERDIHEHPERLQPVTEAFVERLRRAAGGMEIDPYAPIVGPVDL
jgi:hypothetical protein